MEYMIEIYKKWLAPMSCELPLPTSLIMGNEKSNWNHDSRHIFEKSNFYLATKYSTKLGKSQYVLLKNN